MAKPPAHRWVFTARFRRRGFGWRSAPAVQRVKEAVSEITAVARSDVSLAAEGSVRFLEKVSPALEQVDSSSGALGSAVNRAIDTLVPLIAAAPVTTKTRDRWLDRLWKAYRDDQIPYIEYLGDHWGTLCASPPVASRWADAMLDDLRENWSEREQDSLRVRYFQGTTICFSSLLAAQRHQELLDLLEQAPFRWWLDRRWGFRALVEQQRVDDAIAYAEASRGNGQFNEAIDAALEALLLANNRADEAYKRFALSASHGQTYLVRYRTLVKKYPHKAPEAVLSDLVASTPGQKGKWFATAKTAGLYDLAIRLAQQSPCDPKTLTRAARDFAQKRPAFAVAAGLAALHWLVDGYGYEISALDVHAAYRHTLEAADAAGELEQTVAAIKTIVAAEQGKQKFVTRCLGQKLGLPAP